MKTQIRLEADAKTLDVLAKFLAIFEQVTPKPVCQPKAVLGEDNIIFVEVGYKTDDDSFLVGDRMAEVAADLLDETGVLVVLAPFGGGSAANPLNLTSAQKGGEEAKPCHIASRDSDTWRSAAWISIATWTITPMCWACN